MKKLYTTLVRIGALFFALILVLLPVYSNACDCSCSFTRTEVTVITQAATPTIPVAPVAQAMETQVAALTPVQEITIQAAPVAQVMEAKAELEHSPTLVRPAQQRLIPRLELTERQREKRAQFEEQRSREARPEILAEQLPNVLEGDETSDTVPAELLVKITAAEPKQQDQNRILLDAIKYGNYAEALEILTKQKLSYEQLNARSRNGTTPILYAMKYEYWDVVKLLLRSDLVELPEIEKIKSVIPAEKQRLCLMQYATLTFKIGMNL